MKLSFGRLQSLPLYVDFPWVFSRCDSLLFQLDGWTRGVDVYTLRFLGEQDKERGQAGDDHGDNPVSELVWTQM